MIPLTLEQVATAVAGRLVDGAAPDAVVTAGVEFDSRAIEPGGLFVALPGERVDGHDFAARAVAAGAVAALLARPVGVPGIVVDDPQDALGRLAAAVVRHLPDLRTIGVTGSAGKTSTKDLIAALLRPLGPTVAPPGSFNNEIGHPHTVLRADRDTRFLVLENSARGVGHIAALCRIAPPDMGAVLNIGSAHLGEFGSREAIAQAKGELVEALAPSGLAVLNADDPLVAAMRARTAARVVTFGTAPEADLRATDVAVDATGRASYTVHSADVSAPVRLQVVGEHQVSNSLAALAVAQAAGRSLASAAADLAGIGPASRWRMEVTARPDGVTVLNDAYNANPESMRAALRTLHTIAAGRRSWAVLGSMAELGSFTRDAHRQVGQAAARSGVARLVAVGPVARAIHEAARAEPDWEGESVHVPDIEAASAMLHAQVQPGDVVLVKASRSEGLERLAADLLASTGDVGEVSR